MNEIIKTGWAQRINDTLYNLMSGLGVTTHDKSTHMNYMVIELSKLQLETMYRGDWIARKVVRIPADDATRAWRAWQAENDQIEKIEEVEIYHKIQKKTRKAKTLERLYGGSAMILGVDGSGPATSELKLERLKAECLRFVHVVSKHELQSIDGVLEDDLESPYFGQPRMYVRTDTVGNRVEIHPSRVIRFGGEDLPDPAMASDGWGESVLQAMNDAIVAAGLVAQGTASLLNELKTDVIGIKELSAQVSTNEATALLRRRFEITNLMKSNNRLTLIDKEDTWSRMQLSFASLPELIQTYLQIASASADIPATRMLSKSPDGMNSTGQSDTRNYYDKVGSEQANEITPALSQLDEIIIISALGSRDPNIYYDWNPLWQMTEAEQADTALKKAQVMTADVAAMLIPTDALAKGRQNQLIEDNTYPGLENAIEESDGDVVNPAMEQQLALEAKKGEEAVKQQELGHEQSLETQKISHKQSLEVVKAKPKKKAFGKDAFGRRKKGRLHYYASDAFDPNQPRDPDGQWTSTGGASFGYGGAQRLPQSANDPLSQEALSWSEVNSDEFQKEQFGDLAVTEEGWHEEMQFMQNDPDYQEWAQRNHNMLGGYSDDEKVVLHSLDTGQGDLDWAQAYLRGALDPGEDSRDNFGETVQGAMRATDKMMANPNSQTHEPMTVWQGGELIGAKEGWANIRPGDVLTDPGWTPAAKSLNQVRVPGTGDVARYPIEVKVPAGTRLASIDEGQGVIFDRGTSFRVLQVEGPGNRKTVVEVIPSSQYQGAFKDRPVPIKWNHHDPENPGPERTRGYNWHIMGRDADIDDINNIDDRMEGDFVKIGPDQYKRKGGKGKIYSYAQVKAYYSSGGWDSAADSGTQQQDAWSEGDHPRDPDGKFALAGTGSVPAYRGLGAASVVAGGALALGSPVPGAIAAAAGIYAGSQYLHKRYYKSKKEAQDAAGPGQVVVRMRVAAKDAEDLLK
jgi:uncharacterized protein